MKNLLLIFGVASLCLGNQLNAQTHRFAAPADWKGEQIRLPPGFAPTMKLQGVEQIRFAPGMFDPKSSDFFSYAILFSVSQKPQLTQELLTSELLTYYRGLATTVMKGKGQPINTANFRLAWTKRKDSHDAPPPSALRLSGQLDWIEPFSTQKPQSLNLTIDAWPANDIKRNFIFICASPSAMDQEIWSQLIAIRNGFTKQ